MKLLKYILVLLVLVSCSSDYDDIIDSNSLAAYVLDRDANLGGIIACAASDALNDNVLIFYYPELGASNIRLYEMNSLDDNHEDFANYQLVEAESSLLFNGYLEFFERTLETEKWTIVTFELDNKIQISNPIRLKQNTKPSVWNDEVNINQDVAGMPLFTWEDNAYGDNAICFQVITNTNNDLLSGTYTYENQFQYYNTNNVVLNITREIPPSLLSGSTYNFTLMDVSEDNWVNLVIQNQFQAQ